jgi:hypothetical protein
MSGAGSYVFKGADAFLTKVVTEVKEISPTLERCGLQLDKPTFLWVTIGTSNGVCIRIVPTSLKAIPADVIKF